MSTAAPRSWAWSWTPTSPSSWRRSPSSLRRSAWPGPEAPTRVYHVPVGDGRCTEDLVAAGQYGYAQAAVTSENFPADRAAPARVRRMILLEFGRPVAFEAVVAEAVRRGLGRPTYEDALYFGIAHPEAQRERPIVFLHEPWLGAFGRRDVMCLWHNAGRRELGLEGFDDTWPAHFRFAFVLPD